MSKLHLRQKRKYKNNKGDIVTITGTDKGDNCTIYLGDNGKRFFTDGSVSSVGSSEILGNFSTFMKEESLVNEIT